MRPPPFSHIHCMARKTISMFPFMWCFTTIAKLHKNLLILLRVGKERYITILLLPTSPLPLRSWWKPLATIHKPKRLRVSATSSCPLLLPWANVECQEGGVHLQLKVGAALNDLVTVDVLGGLASLKTFGLIKYLECR